MKRELATGEQLAVALRGVEACREALAKAQLETAQIEVALRLAQKAEKDRLEEVKADLLKQSLEQASVMPDLESLIGPMPDLESLIKSQGDL